MVKSSNLRRVICASFFSFLSIFILLMVVAVVRHKATKTSLELINIINIAGKQRMYSQRLVSLTLQNSQGNRDLKPEIIKELRIMNTSQKMIMAYLQENKKLDNLIQLGELNTQLNNFNNAIEKLILFKTSTDEQKKLLNSLAQIANGPLLIQLDNVVNNLIQKYSETVVKYDQIASAIRALLVIAIILACVIILYFLYKIERDLCERDEKFINAEKKSSLLIDSVKDYAIFILNREGFIETWNTGAEKIKGYKADEIIGKHFSIFYTNEDIEEL